MVAGITIPGSYAVRFCTLNKETDREMISICVTCSPFLVVIPGRAFFLFSLYNKKRKQDEDFLAVIARVEDFLQVLIRAKIFWGS